MAQGQGHTPLQTADGSGTLISEQHHCTYHSKYGALTESRHVFLETGLQEAIKRFGRKLNILEAGFGTGLNALLTLQAARDVQLECWYTALEKFPISPDLLPALDYARASGHTGDEELFRSMHEIPFTLAADITDFFVLEKRLIDFRDFSDTPYRYHLVYFDAFAPEVQPELWTAEVFSRIAAAMAPEGVLVTYSSKGEVRRTLQSCGFSVEKVTGPPGKREIVRAVRK
ncbi:MAG: tRNA (5-methylaminomethyl-2-thiouridine)(34)-methyltransferase MnmD [Bacteroidota bacterium]